MTLLDGRTSENRFASLAGPMLPRLLLFAMLMLVVTACGVKNDLAKPNGQTTPRDERDPSKPPYPLGH
jgi:hypothetical protein